MSFMETSKKRIYRNLFFVSLIFLSISIFLSIDNFFSKEDRGTIDKSVSISEYKKLEAEIQFLNDLRRIDNQLLFENNHRSTQLSLERLLQEDAINIQQFRDEIKSRIQYVKNLIEDQKENELSRISLRNQLLKQDKQIDSLYKFKDSLNLIINQSKLVYQRKMDSLSIQLKKKSELLNLKETVKIISFKNTNGNTIRYLGETYEEQANGNGIGIWDTSSIYKGEWKNNKRHGQGEFEWSDGQRYIGQFIEGQRTGEGEYLWPSGEKYVGSFKDNKRHGKGVFYDPDGNIKFDGEWKNDKFQAK